MIGKAKGAEKVTRKPSPRAATALALPLPARKSPPRHPWFGSQNVAIQVEITSSILQDELR
jgi:hypothetical protein